MKEIKVAFNPEMVQQCGRVPVFNEKNASTLRTIVAIPFAGACGNPVAIKRLCRGQMPRHKYEE